MDVDDHHYAFTRSFGHNVIASLAGSHMVHNCFVWYKVLTDEDSRTACICMLERESTKYTLFS